MAIKHNITNQTKTEVTISIELTKDFIDPYFKSVMKKLKKDLKVAGFRPGQAPDKIAIREIGEDRVGAEVVNEIVRMGYARAIRELKITPMGSPKIEIKKWVPYELVEFSSTTPISPTLDDSYKKIRLPEPKVEASDKEVDAMVEEMRKAQAKKAEKSEPIANGDEVVFDFTGTRAGKPVEGASAQNHTLGIGSGQFIPGFEEELIGLKAGEQKTFDIVFPKEYHATDLAGKKVTFEIKVNSVKSVELEELSDEFAKKLGPVSTLKQLREDVKKAITEQKKGEASQKYENELMEKLVEQYKFELSDVLVEEEIHRLEHDMEHRWEQYGLDREKYLEMNKKSEDDFKKELETEALKRLKLALIFQHLIAEEGVDLSDEEIDTEVERLKISYQNDVKMQEEMKHGHFRDDVANHLLSNKAIDRLKDFANKK